MSNMTRLSIPMTSAAAMLAASRQVWLAGLGAAVVTRDWAEREAGRVFRTLVKEGTVVESRAIRLVGDRVETSLTRANAMWQQTRAARVEATVSTPPTPRSTFVRSKRCRRYAARLDASKAPARSRKSAAKTAQARSNRSPSAPRHEGARRRSSSLHCASTKRWFGVPVALASGDFAPAAARHAATSHAASDRPRHRMPGRERSRKRVRATRRARVPSGWPSRAAARSAASTRSARCWRSPIRSTASTSTTSTSTSACRPAASSPRRSPTASRRRRCTGSSSTTAPTPR